MSREYKTLLAIIAGGSVAVPLMLSVALGWPTWLWGSLVVVLLVLTAMLGRHHYERGRWGERYDPPVGWATRALRPMPRVE